MYCIGHFASKTEWHNILVYRNGLQNYVMQTVTKGYKIYVELRVYIFISYDQLVQVLLINSFRQRVLLNGKLSYSKFEDREGISRSSTNIILGKLTVFAKVPHMHEQSFVFRVTVILVFLIYFYLSLENLVALNFPKTEREAEDMVEDEPYDA